jgi:hypothetical protein
MHRSCMRLSMLHFARILIHVHASCMPHTYIHINACEHKHTQINVTRHPFSFIGDANVDAGKYVNVIFFGEYFFLCVAMYVRVYLPLPVHLSIYMRTCLCVCMCARAFACVCKHRVQNRVRYMHQHTHLYTRITLDDTAKITFLPC